MSTDHGMVLLETALPATDTMETISLVVREQDSARCPVAGKNLEQNLGKNVLGNRFDSLIVEENKEKDTQV